MFSIWSLLFWILRVSEHNFNFHSSVRLLSHPCWVGPSLVWLWLMIFLLLVVSLSSPDLLFSLCPPDVLRPLHFSLSHYNSDLFTCSLLPSKPPSLFVPCASCRCWLKIFASSKMSQFLLSCSHILSCFLFPTWHSCGPFGLVVAFELLSRSQFVSPILTTVCSKLPSSLILNPLRHVGWWEWMKIRYRLNT